MRCAVLLSFLRSRPGAAAWRVAPPLRLLPAAAACAALGVLAWGPGAARATPPECEAIYAIGPDCATEWVLEEAQDEEADCEAQEDEESCGGFEPEIPLAALTTLPRSSVELLPSTGGRRANGALLQTRLATPWASGYLDAVLSASQGGTRIGARGMGLQMRLPRQGGELLLGRYVSGGAGLRPDLPIIGLRYSSRVVGTPAPATGPAASPALAGSITLPGVGSDEPLGRLDFKVRELQGSTAVTAAGNGLRLLPRGTSDFALEAGTLARNAEGFEDTGVPAAALTVRHGWVAQQTLSARAVRAGDSLLLAGLSEFRLMGLATAGATVRERGQGAEPGWLLAHEYQVQGLTSRLRFEGLDGDVKAGGNGLLGTPSRRKAELALSWALNPASAISFSAGERLKLDGERAELLSLSSSLRSSSGEQLSVGLKRSRDGVASTQFTLDWRIPLESRWLSRRSPRSLAAQGGLR